LLGVVVVAEQRGPEALGWRVAPGDVGVVLEEDRDLVVDGVCTEDEVGVVLVLVWKGGLPSLVEALPVSLDCLLPALVTLRLSLRVPVLLPSFTPVLLNVFQSRSPP
jgi:hypothetical protein